MNAVQRERLQGAGIVGEWPIARPFPRRWKRLLAAELPDGNGWQYRAQMGRLPLPRAARRRRSHADIQVRQAARRATFPKSSTCCARMKAKHFLLDGELIIPVGDALSFDALAAAPAPRRKPRPQAVGRDAGRADGLRPARARRQVAAE